MDTKKSMDEFIKENDLCTVCAGAGDVWDGNPESDPPPCDHCGGTGLEPKNDETSATRAGDYPY